VGDAEVEGYDIELKALLGENFEVGFNLTDIPRRIRLGCSGIRRSAGGSAAKCRQGWTTVGATVVC
jgi:hypothetical protein